MRGIPGAAFAAVGGMDGLLVEQVPDEYESLPEAIAELTTVLAVARHTTGDILGGGPLAQVTVEAEDMSLAVWIVNEDFWCVVGSELAIDTRATEQAARHAVERIRGSLT